MFTGSKKELLDIIKRSGETSIDDAVEAMQLAKTTLREHLLQLERDGYIQRDYIRSGPGRPSLQYRLTQKGHSLYPSSESTLLRTLIRYLKEEGEEETIENFFQSFWNERLEKAKNRMNQFPQTDVASRMEALMSMLQEEGFMPEFQLGEKDESVTVKECNCPFSEVIKETRLPCKLEALFYQKLFNREASRTTYIPEGDYSCTYDIPLDTEN